MNNYVTKDSVKRFYRDTIGKKKENREGLFEAPSPKFRKLIEEDTDKSKLKAIDLGYGYGNYTVKLAKAGYFVTAVDYIPEDILRARLNRLSLRGKVEIVEADLEEFDHSGDVDVVVAKDVLHFLSQERVQSLLEWLVSKTNIGGWHYLVIFVDIQRQNLDDSRIKVEREADFKINEFRNIVTRIYCNWDLEFQVEEYKEPDRSGREGKFYFCANRITVIAKKV